MLADPPRELPAGLTSLSVSSVALYLKCPMRWKRRYIDRDYEPSSGALIVGSAVGRAEGASCQQQLSDGYRMSTADVRDFYSDAFDLKAEEEADRGPVDWDAGRPGRMKDQGYQALKRYHNDVAPHITPTSVERRFEIALPHVDWTFTGYFDLEAAVGRLLGVDDYKCRSHDKGVIKPPEAAAELQPTGYLFAKRAEALTIAEGAEQARELREQAQRWLDGPRVFRFHSMVRPNVGPALPRDVRITPTYRTDQQLDSFLSLLYTVATEIAWRVENDVWSGAAPGEWYCAPKWCGFWATCPFGGAHRPTVEPAPLRVVKPTADQVLAAVAATARKDSTTTAKRVADHLGVTQRSASGSLAALRRRGAVGRKDRAKNGNKLAAPAFWIEDDGSLERDLKRSLDAAATNPTEGRTAA